MDSATFRARQAPLKDRYRQDPAAALVTARATATLTADGGATVPTWAGAVSAGLHPATGGDGSLACSADMLLQAVASCAAVTLNSIAIARGITLRKAVVGAEGTWDARGTLGVAREVPVGLTSVRLTFDLDSDADAPTQARLIELTERYCVVLQTLLHPPQMQAALGSSPSAAHTSPAVLPP
jgi:uncharacterized OsmC-like protein